MSSKIKQTTNVFILRLLLVGALYLLLLGFATPSFAACGGNGQRACTIFERIPSCNSGLMEVAGSCEACGANGERACPVTVQVPSCDSGLVEAFDTHRCKPEVEPIQVAEGTDCGSKDGVALPCWTDHLESNQGLESLPYYPYAQRANGCSYPGVAPGSIDSYTSLGFTFSFREACNHHDDCYGTLGSNPETCNIDFYRDLTSACHNPIRRTNDPVTQELTKHDCLIRRDVMTGGQLASQAIYHTESQEEQRTYLDRVEQYIRNYAERFDKVSLLTHGGTYLGVEHGGAVYTHANRGNDQLLILIDNDDGTISLKSHHDTYLWVDQGGMVKGDAVDLGNWGKFTKVANADGTVSFKSFHDRFLWMDGNGTIKGAATELGGWGKFRMSETLSFNTHLGTYLRVRDDGAVDTSLNLDIWEKFTAIPDVNGKIGLQSFHRKYLWVDEGGQVKGNAASLDEWGMFTVITNPGGTISLKSHLGKYLWVDAGGQIHGDAADLALIGESLGFQKGCKRYGAFRSQVGWAIFSAHPIQYKK